MLLLAGRLEYTVYYLDTGLRFGLLYIAFFIKSWMDQANKVNSLSLLDTIYGYILIGQC